MAFAAVPTTKVEALMKTLSKKKDEHNQLNKGTNKSLKARDISKLEKEIKDISTRIQKSMSTDLKTVRDNFEKHATNIQNLMIQAAKYLATAEKAAKEGQSGGAFEKLQAK